MVSHLSEEDRSHSSTRIAMPPDQEQGEIWQPDGDGISLLAAEDESQRRYPPEGDISSPTVQVCREDGPERRAASSEADPAGGDLHRTRLDTIAALRDELGTLAAASARYPPGSSSLRMLRSYMAEVEEELNAIAPQESDGGRVEELEEHKELAGARGGSAEPRALEPRAPGVTLQAPHSQALQGAWPSGTAVPVSNEGNDSDRESSCSEASENGCVAVHC